MKFNFDVHSAGAWTTLISALIAAVAGISSAVGVSIDSNTLSTVSGIIAGVISLLTAGGILTGSQDKKEGKK